MKRILIHSLLAASLMLSTSGCDLMLPLVQPIDPQPRSSASTSIQISKLVDHSGEEDSDLDLRTVSAEYKVTVANSNENRFVITLPIAVEHLTADFENIQLNPERYDELSGQWVPSGEFANYDADTRTVSFWENLPIKNFSTSQNQTSSVKYRVRIYIFSNMRTVHREGSQFRIHYYPTRLSHPNAIISDTNWGRQGLNEAPEIPDFIEDLDAALNDAYTLLLAQPNSTGKVFKVLSVQDVYVRDTGGEAGKSQLGGPLAISNKRITRLADLKLTVAHELVHVFQGQYYSLKGLFSGYQNWAFIEATANYYAAKTALKSEQEKADFFKDTSSNYLSVALSKNDENSMYSAGHLLDWLSTKYGAQLVGDTLSKSSGNDWVALSQTIRDVNSTESLGSAYQQYVTEILTRPEDSAGLNGVFRGQLAARTSEGLQGGGGV